VHMSALLAAEEVLGVWSVVDGHSVVAGQGHGWGLCWLCLGFVVVVVGRGTMAWLVGCWSVWVVPVVVAAAGVPSAPRVVRVGLRLEVLGVRHFYLVGGGSACVSGALVDGAKGLLLGTGLSGSFSGGRGAGVGAGVRVFVCWLLWRRLLLTHLLRCCCSFFGVGRGKYSLYLRGGAC